MTWTYSGDPSDSPRDEVRFLVGDTNTNKQLVSDEEIAFALASTSDSTYGAAALCARAIAGKFSREVNGRFESIWSDDGSKSKQFFDLARRLDIQAKTAGGLALGSPYVGGVSRADMESVRANTDRVDSAFMRGQFSQADEFSVMPDED